MPELHCIVVTPDATVLDTGANFVALPLFDGEVGIAPRHAPMIGRLGLGELRVVSASGTQRYYVEGGFVEVLDDTVSVLTGRGLPAELLDEAVVQEQLETARSQTAHSPESMEQRDRAVAQSRAQWHVVRRAQQA